MTSHQMIEIEKIATAALRDKRISEEAIAQSAWWSLNYGQSRPIIVKPFHHVAHAWGQYYVVNGATTLLGILQVRETHPEMFQQVQVIELPPNGPVELQKIMENLNK
ncbi:MAG TPA: hypothetical protein V6D27_00985 [Vampirovibrionales bacterium]